MPIRDIPARCASLANDYGASHGANAPDEFEVALFIGDPNGDGVEVDVDTTLVDEDTGLETVVPNGYAPATVDNDGTVFPAADPDTGVLTTPLVTFPVSLEEYPGTVTHWLLRDPVTGDGWDTGALPHDETITVAAAGVTPRLVLSIFYNPNPSGLV
jgi:hypothetical protein